MRKIETQMIAAVHGNKNWSSGNTQVVTNCGVSTVYLHGNKIAMIDDNSMTIFDGGYQTKTTKSRLNALRDEFRIAGEGVFQKDFLCVCSQVRCNQRQKCTKPRISFWLCVCLRGLFPSFFIPRSILPEPVDQVSQHRPQNASPVFIIGT